MPSNHGAAGGTTPDQDVLTLLRHFIDARGAQFLRDPNISSIGIGYKVTAGAPDGPLSLQFTVEHKTRTDALGALGTRPIPATVDLGGHRVPTDVLERSFAPAYRIVADTAPARAAGRLDPVTPGAGIAPELLGDPELGDTVVKSGRTTGVTHGVVRRVDVLARIGYGTAGERIIGCFEIGPDPQRRPRGDVTTAAGDSGAAWLFTSPGEDATTVLAGLNFARETTGHAGEHALACPPRDVFRALDLVLHPPARPETVGDRRAGYAADFLGTRVEEPSTDPQLRGDNVRLGESEVIPYTHFSVVLSASRRLARWVAWNIDGTALERLPRTGMDFVLDPRIPREVQTGRQLYRGNRLDCGHIARRADLLWGGPDAARRANRDSYYFPNIAPQLDDFNQSSRRGVWGRIEEAVFADVELDDLRVSVFGGPVFGDDDRVYRGTRIPREYWKIVAFVDRGRLKARAFLLTQNLDGLEALELDEFRVFQVAVAEVEERTGVRFGEAMHRADSYVLPESRGARQALTTPGDIQW